MLLAQYLEAHPGIESVIYPGLPSHPQHELAKRQMRAFGGMIAIKVKGDLAITKTFVHSLKYFIPAASLGGVESLVDHPPISTHVGMTQEQWDSMGMSDNMVRLSVGLEDIDDLKADMDQALKSAGAA
jgi:cystathionine gamma-lyase